VILIVDLVVTVFDLVVSPPKDKPGTSNGWVAIFPILIVLIVASLAIWKRKEVKSFYDSKMKNSKK